MKASFLLDLLMVLLVAVALMTPIYLIDQSLDRIEENQKQMDARMVLIEQYYAEDLREANIKAKPYLVGEYEPYKGEKP
jgi:hypothetical protein